MRDQGLVHAYPGDTLQRQGIIDTLLTVVEHGWDPVYQQPYIRSRHASWPGCAYPMAGSSHALGDGLFGGAYGFNQDSVKFVAPFGLLADVTDCEPMFGGAGGSVISVVELRLMEGAVVNGDTIGVLSPELVVGLHDLVQNEVSFLYPNPARDVLYVPVEGTTRHWRIRDARGTVVASGSLRPGEVMVETSSLNAGLYTFDPGTGSRHRPGRFIVAR